ncbi:PLP-dependent aminotransferase family protein [Inconstantimicrobium mannanitabidum]|uniref:GntR family transcriptional regulator n=1 Tax=Inconstantimicrobium mannanitabidum TaxID=1604901 RepID=A0ACB5RDL8_9CLOT|nr:PLP-dependent aminotransferase family protein [Clostridium sp. TW13]GKX67353.1 GntR family transcriptional regulator [Clostridium sp. TW13]
MSKYKDIVDYIIDEIDSNNIKFNEKMPTIRDLSEKFNCSKQTVVHAYDKLQKEHIVYSIPQSGYYLVDKKEMHSKKANKIINFAAGSPDESILPYEDFQHCLNQAIDIYKGTLFNYSDAKGLPELINTLKTHFQDYQIFCSSDDIFITSGSQQAINILCSMPFPNGKSNVLVEQPTYKGALKALAINKTPVIGIERKSNGLDFEELERKFANDNIKCFYTIPRFSNPLGLSYTNDEKKQIIRLAEKYDVYIIEDDYLADLEYRNNSYPMYYHDISSRVAYIKSFSKILLPGLRIAAVVLPKILRNTFEDYKRWMDLNTSVLSQGALEIYIKSGMFKANRKLLKQTYSERMNEVKKICSESHINNIDCHIPETGFYGYIEFLKGVNINLLIRECNKKYIYIKDLKDDYLNDFFSNDIIKISVGCSGIDEINKGMSDIFKIIQNWY